MKNPHHKKVANENRKIRKPIMEKKRRARINDSLETLKQILLDSKATLKESVENVNGQRVAKLEKADILEMTVRYLQHLRSQLNQSTTRHKRIKEEVTRSPADSSSDAIKIAFIPTNLSVGDVVFVMPSKLCSAQKQISVSPTKVWRPWSPNP